MAETEVLIVGAGPVGLTAAIELSRRGKAVRVVDRDPEPTSESRAIAIQPRTLDLLEATGVTERLLAAGVRVKGVRVVAEGHLRATLDLTEIPHRFNFLLSLPQDRTERTSSTPSGSGESRWSRERRRRASNPRRTGRPSRFRDRRETGRSASPG
jgi:2-polyprenyl-6-methoxyphenol hydroxylase-like FAD-dependent oxidoreductase